MTNPAIDPSWQVHVNNAVYSGKTKEQALSNAKSAIEKQESEGFSWELHQVWTTPRTKPYPNVLIVGSVGEDGSTRPHEYWIHKFNQTNLKPGTRRGRLHEVDSSGTRSVFFYSKNVTSSADYETAIDLPKEIFQELASFLKENKVPVHLFLLQKDPGLAIVLPQDTPHNGFGFTQENILEEVTK